MRKSHPLRGKAGFTLLEILVSTVILALVMTGLVNLFVAGKRYIAHSRSRMTSGELGRIFLDYLQMQVRGDTWAAAGNALQAGIRDCGVQPGCPAVGDRTLGGIIYNARYTIDRDQPVANVNRVKIDITWTEHPP